jgi:hypothetical protein
MARIIYRETSPTHSEILTTARTLTTADRIAFVNVSTHWWTTLLGIESNEQKATRAEAECVLGYSVCSLLLEKRVFKSQVTLLL